MTEVTIASRIDRVDALSPEWRALHEAYRATGRKLYGPLSATMRWCSAHGVAPDEVDANALRSVAGHLG